MNRYGLKQAAKQCLHDADRSPAVITLIFLLVLLAFNIPELILSYWLQAQMNTALESMMAADTEDWNNLYRYALEYTGYYERLLAVEVVFGLIGILWQVGYYSYTLRLSRRYYASASNLLDGLRKTGKVIWLYILISFFTFLWSCLFVIPGIVAAYRYRMAYYALLDDPSLTARQALNVSKRITQGHKGELFMLDLSFLGWDFLIVLTCGILAIWKLPYILATYAHAFNWMLQEDRRRQQSYENRPPFGQNPY